MFLHNSFQLLVLVRYVNIFNTIGHFKSLQSWAVSIQFFIGLISSSCFIRKKIGLISPEQWFRALAVDFQLHKIKSTLFVQYWLPILNCSLTYGMRLASDSSLISFLPAPCPWTNKSQYFLENTKDFCLKNFQHF